MTVDSFINAGYRVSQHLDANELNTAVTDAKVCYADRVSQGLDESDGDYAAAVMAVAYVLLLRRSAVATRAGGKEKLTPMQSQTMDATQWDLEKADSYLKILQGKPEGIPGRISELVNDIACIYYRNTFLSL